MSKIVLGNWNEMVWQPLRDGVSRVVLGMDAERMCVTLNEVKNGHVINPHSHDNEQIALILQGTCDYYVDGVPYRMSAGSWLVVPPGLEHYAHVYDSELPCLNMDIFVPDRQEFTDSYTNFLNSLDKE